ncbi:MAG: response regulator [Planctomycetaceae bacterium]|nr:response regulator [Planctomycetaceae bacterium]
MTPPVPPVLLVEDDPNHAMIFAHAWKRAGRRPTLETVSDGDQAVAFLACEGAFQERARDVVPTRVILDLKLPRRSGLDVLAWIREQPRLRALPVSILTSSEETSDRTRAEALGVEGFHVKPVGLAELVQLIQRIEPLGIQGR